MNEDALTKALAAATEAADDSKQLEVVKAVLIAQAISRAADQPQRTCQHDHQPRQGRSTGEWLGIGGAVCVGGLGIAIGFIAIAICGISVAILALILRSLWRDYLNNR
ncbi:hypothetical protein ACFUJT_31550 [Streptomyces griseoincarnatus]